MIAGGSAIVHGFQTFYYELLRQKEKALSFYSVAEVVLPTSDENSDNGENSATTYIPDDKLEGTIVSIQRRLIKAINSANALILEKSHLSEQSVENIRYVLTTLSDEIFLNLNWEGKERWKLYLLEKQLFSSEIAGDRFFELAENAITSQDEEMAFVCLMSINLGFKGKFRDVNHSGEYIATYKNRLYSLVHQQSNRLFYPGRPHLIENCYNYTCIEGCAVELPDTKYWSTCIMCVLIIYLIVSYIIWYNITDDIYSITDQINKQLYTYSNEASLS